MPLKNCLSFSVSYSKPTVSWEEISNWSPPQLRGFICAYHPCDPRFDSQAHYLCFYHLQLNLYCFVHVERTKINKKRPSLAVVSSAPTILAAPGSIPKHTFYAFSIYSQICTVFVQNKQKEAGFIPFRKMKKQVIDTMLHASAELMYTLIYY